MSVTLGRENFPDTVLTAPWSQVMTMFALRAAAIPLHDRTAKQLIEDWTADLERLRKPKQGGSR